MKIIEEITYREMTRRWAIGEVMSVFFHRRDKAYQQDTLRLLTCGNQDDESEGIRRHQITRGSYISSIPPGTTWYLSKLSVTEEEFAKLYTDKSPGWKRYSGGTFRLSDVATFLREDPSQDLRIAGMISELQNRRFEPIGITLIEENSNGPYTILEGNGRLAAVYIQCLLQDRKSDCPSELEVILGRKA